MYISCHQYLHPTMYLLIPPAAAVHQLYNTYLHPTMYLLIPQPFKLSHNMLYLFTSHYVSINSKFNIKVDFSFYEFTSHYVSINSDIRSNYQCR